MALARGAENTMHPPSHISIGCSRAAVSRSSRSSSSSHALAPALEEERQPLLSLSAPLPDMDSHDAMLQKSGKDRRPSSIVITDDADAVRLAELGYTQVLSRKFSVWSLLGVGFSLTNSWFGLSAAMVTGINSGGTALIIYGVIIVACVSDSVIDKYHVFAAYQVINAFAAIFNCYGRTLPWTASFTLYVSLISFFVILVTVPSVTPAHKPASFVFATFINNTGWNQSGIAFIVGLINTNWPFCCLDCATHLSEEVPRPERNIPIAICGTVAIGFVTAWFFAVAMFFSLYGDFEQLVSTPTGVPILALFYSALTGRSAQVAGAIVLESLILATGLGCQIASHTWQSRLLWSFARDGGVPGSKYLAVTSEKLDVPLRAHLVSCALVAMVGSLYLGSYTAFNSMVTATIVLLYISYAVPIYSLLFVRGRNNIRHGPFWLGKIGMVANVVVLCWTVFTLVMYSFPYTMPVAPENMNYVSAVYFAVSVIVAADWIFRGRKEYGHV
ncbi:choline transporter [Elasticomyces elasticus]|uniref:Choline transporter n=1 Tax=Elasticomyces elasticus TaxID=574655 RepID=A0AAN7VX58_9PEZI|nr:choline transporter [Elasticomyces elasticus]